MAGSAARAGAADVVVVGGGIIGCATAYELARGGASVVLIERAELASGASGRNHGLLLAPLDPSLVPMARWSSQTYDGIRDDAPLPIRLDAEPIGFLIVAGMDEGEAAAARAEAEAAALCGVEIEWLDAPTLHRAEPALAPDLVEGWLLDDARRLDPAALTVSLGVLARRHGAIIRRPLSVRGLIVRGGRVGGVLTEEGPVEAGTVVLAAGPWCPPLLRAVGAGLPLSGARGWLVQLAPPESVVRHLIARAGWHLLGGEVPVSPPTAAELEASFPPAIVGSLLHPNGDGSLLAGGSRQPVVTAEPEDDRVPRRIVREAVRLVPALAGSPVLSSWWGIRPMTPDGRPVVDTVSAGLVVATGHGSQGVILGGGTGRLVASIVLGDEPPFDPAPFRASRFDGRHASPAA